MMSSLGTLMVEMAYSAGTERSRGSLARHLKQQSLSFRSWRKVPHSAKFASTSEYDVHNLRGGK